MRTPLIAGNWKMNTTVSEAAELVYKMKDALDEIDGVEKVICPPFISLATIAEIIKDSSLKLGAQNTHFAEKGAYTGEISPLMLSGLCHFVIVGHSERRQYFNDTDEIVNKKVKAALKAGIAPILCVGEELEDNTAGRTAEVISRQLEQALDDIESPDDTVIAYEPIWAIGNGKSASGREANATIGLIRDKVADIFNTGAASAIRILYGGSVTADNIADFVGQPEIDGALVGGASLRVEQFISIVEQATTASGSH